jgi:uncharacterized LabA/DUF88 family protein
MSRTAIFIDGGCLKKVLKLFGEPKIEYLEFSERLAGGKERLRTYYYDCMPYRSSPPTVEETRRCAAMQRFLDHLRRLPRFEVRLGRLAKRPSGFEQKRVDVLFAVDLTRLSASRQIGQAVLVTSDSDFVPAIQAAKNDGVLVQLYYSPKLSYNDELLQACDDRMRLPKNSSTLSAASAPSLLHAALAL